ncbi:PPOX class F420-dependent oxidoreductase [Natronosporangium hydrolyticum]|uniref:PPOX class F420-dependent oxidoreductase n=1 Tax=Natronosporangium hydrolyticum TaxID=2811111 RepID=A0A895YLY9_9ACTN|nr:PPOX class F420-dependent oxidoreductase [Natronosporangium hydrolyticum]QSB15120.1 PPOX class F420-dependent oxidoreductase [Natronosporangium hydrolyticum]
MARDEAIAFLAAGTRTGKLATASPSGNPHVAPVWFLVDGEELVFVTGNDSRKGRHLRANPRAALAVDGEAFPYTFVTVRGPVRVTLSPADLLDWNTRIAERYVPADRVDEYGARNTGPDELLCRLRMERVVAVAEIAD